MTTPIDDISQSEVSTRLQRAQMQGAQQRVSKMSQIVTDLTVPAVTPHDISLARQWREQNSIALGDKLYLFYKDKASQAILSYMENLGIDADTIEFARTNLNNVQYKSTYTEQNPEFGMEPGNVGTTTMILGDISNMPLNISMRHVIEEAAFLAGDLIKNGLVSSMEAVEVQYISVLLHELMHVASSKLYSESVGLIGRSGLMLCDKGGIEMGDMRIMNEVVTDKISEAIFGSTGFQSAVPITIKGKYHAGYKKHYPEFYQKILMLLQGDEISVKEIDSYIAQGYFGSFGQCDLIRTEIFGQDPIIL